MSAISLQFSVAAHVMTALGYHEGERVSSAQLAEGIHANPSFVRKSLSKLAKAGLIEAARGKNGASRLARPAAEITVLDVYRATATKGAVDAITGVLSRELGPRKIRVNAINPGMVETEGTHSAGFIGSDLEQALVPQTPLGRIGRVTDIAPVAVFLASDDAAWLTGELLLASGGLR
jgi:3-oxoacyl-[acyl-carrier protein] reductase